MKTYATKGFTLIELLVVITIIGSLATGATAVYTSAQQKARDSIRQNDVLALRSAIEQSFGDNAFYPQTNALYAGVITAGYMQALPSDPKTGQADSQTKFLYMYGAAQDHNTNVAGQEYEVSANFENTGNAGSKEIDAADGGGDGNRWEIGVSMDTVNTNLSVDVNGDEVACTGNTYGSVGGSAGTGTCVKVDDITS